MEIDLSGLQEEEEGERRDLADDLLVLASSTDWLTPMIGFAGQVLRGWEFFNVPGDMIAEVRAALAGEDVELRNQMLIGFEPGSRFTFYVPRRQVRRAKRVLRSLGLRGGNL